MGSGALDAGGELTAGGLAGGTGSGLVTVRRGALLGALLDRDADGGARFRPASNGSEASPIVCPLNALAVSVTPTVTARPPTARHVQTTIWRMIARLRGVG